MEKLFALILSCTFMGCEVEIIPERPKSEQETIADKIDDCRDSVIDFCEEQERIHGIDSLQCGYNIIDECDEYYRREYENK